MNYIIYYFYLKWLFNPTDLISTLSVNDVKRILYGIHARDADFKGRSAYTLEELEVLYGVLDSRLTVFTTNIKAVTLSSDNINPLTLADILDEVNMQLPCFGINTFLNKQIPTKTFIKENIPNTLHPSGRIYKLLIRVGFIDTDFTNFYTILDVISTILANATHVHTNTYNRWILIAKVICRVIDSIKLLERLHYTVFRRSSKWPDSTNYVAYSEDFNTLVWTKSDTTITEPIIGGIQALPLEYDPYTGIRVVKVVDTLLDIENNKEPIIKSGIMNV